MRRIGIEWDTKGMVGGIITGVVTITDGSNTNNTSPTLSAFYIDVSKNFIGMRSMGNYLPPGVEEHRDLIHTLARCYYEGMIHESSVHHWIV